MGLIQKSQEVDIDCFMLNPLFVAICQLLGLGVATKSLKSFLDLLNV